MKKLVFAFVLSTVFISCGKSTSTSVDTTVVDSATVDSIVTDSIAE